MLIGETGTGKSSQICTLEGTKLLFAFDPNTLASIDGYASDIDIQEIKPSKDDLSLGLRTMKQKTTAKAPRLYEDWIEDLTSKDLSSYKWLILDSFSFIAQAIMDGTRFKNSNSNEGRVDYMLAGETLTMVARAITAADINILAMAHYTKKRNEVTGKTETMMALPGSSRETLPRMFNNIFGCSVSLDKQGGKIVSSPRYQIQTVPDENSPVSRSAIKGLQPYEDVTLDFNQPLHSQGLGKWFN
jgi:hypothetical protein